jgi:hypothetical protein
VIRFTWIQARTQTMTALGALAALAIVLAITGPHLAHLYDTSIAACAAHGDCPAVRAAFLHNDSTFRTALGVVVIVVPALTGIFWGAPLVARELEAGTFRLIWSQSVTRTSWLAAKLGVVGLASMAVAGLTSLAVTWWASPLDRVRMDPYGTFDQRGIVPIGYAAFGFALGVTAGILIRRTVPAMATALVLFVSARLAFTHWLRPHLIAPAHHDLTITTASVLGYGPNSLGGASTLQLGPPDIPGAWIYSTQLIDRTGLPARRLPGPRQRPVRRRSSRAKRPPHRRAPRRAKSPAGLRREGRRPIPRSGELPARQPLLGLPVVRAGDIPRGCSRSGRSLLLARPTAPRRGTAHPPPATPPGSRQSGCLVQTAGRGAEN